MSRIKFERAKALILWLCDCHLTDWPDCFTACELAHLQHPFKGSPENEEADCLDRAIEYAITNGEIVFEQRTYIYQKPFCSPSSSTYYTQSEKVIKADVFKVWLTLQGETPSEHIQAWFDARCTPPAPDVKVNTSKKERVRRHFLEPKFYLASETTKSNSPDDIWAILFSWASKREHGLQSGTGGSIKYFDKKGNLKNYTKRQLIRYLLGEDVKNTV